MEKETKTEKGLEKPIGELKVGLKYIQLSDDIYDIPVEQTTFSLSDLTNDFHVFYRVTEKELKEIYENYCPSPSPSPSEKDRDIELKLHVERGINQGFFCNFKPTEKDLLEGFLMDIGRKDFEKFKIRLGRYSVVVEINGYEVGEKEIKLLSSKKERMVKRKVDKEASEKSLKVFQELLMEEKEKEKSGKGKKDRNEKKRGKKKKKRRKRKKKVKKENQDRSSSIGIGTTTIEQNKPKKTANEVPIIIKKKTEVDTSKKEKEKVDKKKKVDVKGKEKLESEIEKVIVSDNVQSVKCEEDEKVFVEKDKDSHVKDINKKIEISENNKKMIGVIGENDVNKKPKPIEIKGIVGVEEKNLIKNPFEMKDLSKLNPLDSLKQRERVVVNCEINFKLKIDDVEIQSDDNFEKIFIECLKRFGIDHTKISCKDLKVKNTSGIVIQKDKQFNECENMLISDEDDNNNNNNNNNNKITGKRVIKFTNINFGEYFKSVNEQLNLMKGSIVKEKDDINRYLIAQSQMLAKKVESLEDKLREIENYQILFQKLSK